MGIKPNFSKSDIDKRFSKFLDAIVKRQIERMQYLGEECTKIAKSIPPEIGFMDQTGNLRSSIGYVVFKDGVAVHTQYSGSAEGIDAGQDLAKKVGAKYRNGVALVVTAGMDYAIRLEAKGRDVLTSAENFAKQELPKMVKELKLNINKALVA